MARSRFLKDCEWEFSAKGQKDFRIVGQEPLQRIRDHTAGHQRAPLFFIGVFIGVINGATGQSDGGV
ncbi:MAG: hypothetical protein B7Z66_07750 [Chromatiales bacterium 21-64-14]|nr:MAG: hypothetical protein B7Z66_07750 [Chromatiales bacterium 21-64-14]